MTFKPKVLLDTNIVVDYVGERHPYFKRTRLLLMLSNMGEVDAWLTSSQMTDLVYILSNGGNRRRIAAVLDALKSMRQFIEIHPTSAEEVDAMLTTTWDDPEDYLLYESAKSINADCIISRDIEGFEPSMDIPVFDCDGFFNWLENEHGLVYDEIPS